MSRRQCRERKRAARNKEAAKEAVKEFARARKNPAALPQLLGRLAASDVPVWPIAQRSATLSCRPLDENERAMIAQAVAPHLAGMAVRNRHAEG